MLSPGDLSKAFAQKKNPTAVVGSGLRSTLGNLRFPPSTAPNGPVIHPAWPPASSFSFAGLVLASPGPPLAENRSPPANLTLRLPSPIEKREELGKESGDMEARVASKELLKLEQKKPSFLESNFVVRKKEDEEGDAVRTKAKKKKKKKGDEQPGKDEGNQHATATVPTSQVLGKVRDFLGVIAEANEKLQQSVQGSGLSEHDIEVLSGNETGYIEMDLLLGITDLQTPEAVAVAEAAIGGSQQYLPLFNGNSSSDSEENEHITAEASLSHNEGPNREVNGSLRPIQSRKRPKITVLN